MNDLRSHWIHFALFGLGLSLIGCRHQTVPVDPLAPVAFHAPPTLDGILVNLNSQTQRIYQLQSETASIATAGLPALRTSLAIERPLRFRFRAKLFGPELDLGSNDQFFWMWAKSNPDQAIYFARHDRFPGSAAQRMFPVQPAWLVEAFGLVELPLDGRHEGPFKRADNQYEIRSQLDTAQGVLTRSIIVDSQLRLD